MSGVDAVQEGRAPEAHRGPMGDLFTRHGARTLTMFSLLLLGLMAVSGIAAHLLVLDPLWWVAGLFFLAWCFVLSFFRNPPRNAPAGEDVIVAPADGTVFDVSAVQEDEFIEGAATRIAIFLSVFNCHVNRAPVAGAAEYLHYRPGTFRNALDKEARETNECQALGLRMEDGTPVLVRQIAGLIARRIVCPVREGEWIPKGFDYGMIRFGSQTEVSVPDRGDRRFVPKVAAGDKIQGGETIIGVWERAD